MSTATAFEKAAAEGRAALVGYLPAGFPSVDGAIEAAVAMAESGCDVLEIGLPYSDPLMDGPVIQEATHRALAAGTRVSDVLRTVEAVAGTGVPLLVMTYWNPVDHYGVASFAADLASAGGAGLITPDLPPEEAGEWVRAADKHGLDRVFLVAPSSSDERVMRIARSGLDEPIEIIAVLLRRGQQDGSVPAGIDPVSAARVCAAIFQGLVLQQAWEPDLDIDGYIGAVIALIDRFAGPPRKT